MNGEMKFDAGSIDADELFDVDIGGISKDADPKNNAFAGIEEKLGLPFGSTKDGIKDAKAEMKSITNEVKNLKTTSDIIERKEHMVSMPNVAFTMDDLANDRVKLRDSYMRLFDRGMNMLNKIQEQLDALVNPEPDDYAVWQKQYLACLKALDSIKSALVTLRQEEELRTIKVSQSAAGSNAPAEDGQAAPDGSSPGAVEVTTQETNAWIKQWTTELDKQIKEEIAADHSSRLAEKAVSAIEKENTNG